MSCDLGKLEEFQGMKGYWVYESCPYHVNTRERIAVCDFCDKDGQHLVFFECDSDSHENECKKIFEKIP